MLKLESVENAKRVLLALEGGEGVLSVLSVLNPVTTEGPPSDIRVLKCLIEKPLSGDESNKTPSDPPVLCYSPLGLGLSDKKDRKDTLEGEKQLFNNVEILKYLTPHQRIDVFMKPCLLLPEDKDFLLDKLPRCTGKRNAAQQRYKSEWLAGMAAEPVEHIKQNTGRYRANTWLRGKR